MTVLPDMARLVRSRVLRRSRRDIEADIRAGDLRRIRGVERDTVRSRTA